MLVLANRLANYFSKWSRPKPKPKSKQMARSFAVGDEKAAKLSKAEQEQQNKMRAMQAQKIEKQTTRNIAFMRTHSPQLEEFKSKEELDNIKYYQQFYLKGSGKRREKSKSQDIIQTTSDVFEYSPLQQPIFDQETGKYKKFEPVYGNFVNQINKRYNISEQFQGNAELRRMGTLGIKLGMTTMFDRWGYTVPVTIVLLDRVQVVQVKRPDVHNKFYQVQMGLGQKNLKKCNKAQLGHYLKARVPPKKVLAQFPVSQECLLPIGYMMSARHYTPGMFVDVIGKTVGHGFQGTIKRHGFARQPATHGNSLTTRVLGSTGGRQDPGRVFKQKKMYGHMGNKVTVQKSMTVFRIDVDKNILYIKGSLPGKAGTVLKIRDSILYDRAEQNLKLSHFPTFVQQPGIKYARIFSMYCGERDPDEIQVHDNAFIVDDDQQEKEEVVKDKDLEEQGP